MVLLTSYCDTEEAVNSERSYDQLLSISKAPQRGNRSAGDGEGDSYPGAAVQESHHRRPGQPQPGPRVFGLGVQGLGCQQVLRESIIG